MRQSIRLVLAVVTGLLGTAACGKPKSENAIAKMEQLKDDACACQDEACILKVEQMVRVYQASTLASLQDGKATDAQLQRLMTASGELARCAAKYQLEAGAKFSLESIKQNLPGLKEMIVKGTATLTDCLAISADARNEALVVAAATHPDVAAVIDDVNTLCQHDLPLMVLEAQTKLAEAARATDAKGVLAACGSPKYGMALAEAMKTPAAAAQATVIAARYRAVCPTP